MQLLIHTSYAVLVVYLHENTLHWLRLTVSVLTVDPFVIEQYDPMLYGHDINHGRLNKIWRSSHNTATAGSLIAVVYKCIVKHIVENKFFLLQI